MNNKEIDRQIERFDKFLKKTNSFIKVSERIIEDWKDNNQKNNGKGRQDLCYNSQVIKI